MNILSLNGVSAFYGRVQALRDISIDVAEGEMVGLLGPNGAGKTTILRAISRLVRTEGRITFRGRDISALSADTIPRLGVAHVPEGRGTFSQLTTRENLLVAAAANRRGRKSVRAAVNEVLAYVPQLTDSLDRPAGLLSGGQQQLLAIARGLLGRPQLLMVDEPTLGLAPKLAQDLIAQLRALQQEVGFAGVLVEQNAALALHATDRTYVLRNGTVDVVAASDELEIGQLSRSYFETTTQGEG